jgi:hypothetical protein
MNSLFKNIFDIDIVKGLWLIAIVLLIERDFGFLMSLILHSENIYDI